MQPTYVRELGEEREEEWETYSDGEHARRNFLCAEHQTIQSRRYMDSYMYALKTSSTKTLLQVAL